MPIDGLDDLEEELQGQLPPPVPEQADDSAGLPLAPTGLEGARADRDQQIALANIMQGITQAGSSFGSQGRVKPDSAVFDAIRAQASEKGKEALTDATLRQKKVSDYMKQQLAAKRQGVLDQRDERNYQQRERGMAAAKDARDEASKDRDEARADRREAKDKPTDAQSQSAGFGKRIEQANADFEDIHKSGFNRSDLKSAAVSALPNFVQGHLPNSANGASAQRQDQAERNFLNAVLRRESGASISPDEMNKGEVQYFPRLGDTPEVLEQKARNRAQILESLKVSAGPAWAKVPLVGGQSTGGSDPGADKRRARIAELRAKLGK